MFKPAVLLIFAVLACNALCGGLANVNDQHVLSNGTICVRGTHKDQDKCVSNTDWCEKYDVVTLACDDCKFWGFMTNSAEQGHYCATHWWMWLLFILGLLILLGALGFCLKSWFTKPNVKAAGNYEGNEPVRKVKADKNLGGMHLSGYESYDMRR